MTSDSVPMGSPEPSNPDNASPDVATPAFEGLSNSELAVIRTNLAGDRTAMAEQRTAKSTYRTELAVQRTDLADVRTELARERTRAAAERTLMAWIRTSLSMISFGFGIDRFFKYVKVTNAPSELTQMSEERLLGLGLITLGVAALGGALINHWTTLQSLEKRDYKYAPGGSLGFTIGIVLLFIGLATFVPLLLGEVQLGEIFTVNSQVLQTLVGITVFTLMLTMGVTLKSGDLLTLFKQPQLLARSLLSVLVLYPLGVVIALSVLNLSPRTTIALIILAAVPAAPLLTKRATMAGANISIAAGLQVFFAILSIAVTPLLLVVLTAPFPDIQTRIESLTIAKQIALVQLLPLGLGILVRELTTELAEQVSEVMVTISNTLFLVLAFAIVAVSINLLPQFSYVSLIAFTLVVIVGLGVGHILAGPELGNRAALATATVARNAGLALFIAIANSQPESVLSIVAYLIVGAVVALPYNAWVKLQLKSRAQPA